MGGVLGIGLARSLGFLGGGEVLSSANPQSEKPRLPPASHFLVAGRTAPAAWSSVDFASMDLRNSGEISELVAKVRPSAILHGAAMARPSECESNPEAAWKVNTESTLEAVEAAKRVGARLVFCSTDQVFDGLAEQYPEDARPNPLQVYGATKVAAEGAVLEGGGTVIRLPLLLGPEAAPGRMGADHALLRASQLGRSIGLFLDEVRVPADAAWLAAPLWRLLQGKDLPAIANQPRVYHLAGSQAVSRFEIGEQVCKVAGVPFEHGRSTLSEWHGVPRPPRLVLTCQRAERELGFTPPDLQQSLAWVNFVPLD